MRQTVSASLTAERGHERTHLSRTKLDVGGEHE